MLLSGSYPTPFQGTYLLYITDPSHETTGRYPKDKVVYDSIGRVEDSGFRMLGNQASLHFLSMRRSPLEAPM